MNEEQLIALGLTKEQASKVLEGFKGYVPSARFNEVNEAKKNAEKQLEERDQQLTSLKKAVEGNDELKKQVETLQAENKATKAKYEADLTNFKIENAIDLLLTQSGAKNLTATKALIDKSKLKLDGDKILGLEDQVKTLMQDTNSSFLFNVKNDTPSGVKAGDNKNTPEKKVSEMNYSELVAYMDAGGKLD